MSQAATATPSAGENPLLAEWTTPFQLPPFEAIKPADFEPAFSASIAAHTAEIDAIADNPASPTHINTLDALELAGRALTRVARVFYNLTGSNSSPELQAIEREMAPRLAKHWTTISLNEKLFKRVDAL